MREKRILEKTEMSIGFQAFLRKGGHWSCNIDNTEIFKNQEKKKFTGSC